MRGKLQIRYTVDGRRFEETLDLAQTRGGIADAARIRRQRIEAVMYGHVTQSRTFKEAAQQYLNAKDVELSTRNSYRDSLNIYWSPLGGSDLTSISAQRLIALDDATDWPSEKTRINALTPLRGVFRFAIQRGWLTENPTAVLANGKRPKADPDPYTSEERDALLSFLDTTLAGPYYRVAFGTGARTGELIALTWEDFDGESLYVNRSRVRGHEKGTKTNKPRRVLLLPNTLEAVNNIARPINGGAIFRNQYGKPYQSGYHLNRWFRKAHKAQNVRERSGAYPWRHTYASLALSSGVKPMLIASQLGHRLDVLLERYGRYVPRDDDLTELKKMEVSTHHG